MKLYNTFISVLYLDDVSQGVQSPPNKLLELTACRPTAAAHHGVRRLVRYLSILLVMASTLACGDIPLTSTDTSENSLSNYFDPNKVDEIQIHTLTGNRGGPPNLHSFELFDSKLVSARTAIVSFLQEIEYELRHPGDGMALCFDPHHAISISLQSDTYDILVCYECQNLRIYKNASLVLNTSITNRSVEKVEHLFRYQGVRHPDDT